MEFYVGWPAPIELEVPVENTYKLEWLDKNAEIGPIFKIGRDVYERERPNQRVIRLKAVESYNVNGVEPAVKAFRECAEAWGAPIIFIIQPDLKQPPAARFLYEWSRTSHAIGSVEQCFMKTGNFITRAIGAFVLKCFTDGSMPFEATDDEAELQQRLGEFDLDCPMEGFELKAANAMVRYKQISTSFWGFLLGRVVRNRKGGSTENGGQS